MIAGFVVAGLVSILSVSVALSLSLPRCVIVLGLQVRFLLSFVQGGHQFTGFQ